MTRDNRNNLTIYSVGHFAVDFACIASLTDMKRVMSEVNYGYVLLAYLLLAFGTQFIFGYLADCKKTDNKRNALFGILLCIVGIALENVSVIAVIFFALGNSFYHAGGGADTLGRSKGLTENGVFVSVGALGVLLGVLFGGTMAALFSSAGLLIVCFLLVARFARQSLDCCPSVKKICKSNLGFSLTLALLLFAVALRAYGGALLPFAEKTADTYSLSLLAAFLGKLLGGILSDKIGAGKAALISAALSLVFALLFNASFIFSLIAVLAFNVAMPITLYAVYSKLPKNPGLSFGLTTLSLAVGTLPAYLISVSKTLSVIIFILCATVCLAIFTAALKFKEEKQ